MTSTVPADGLFGPEPADESWPELREGLTRFVDQVVVPLELSLGDIDREPQLLYGADHNFTALVLRLMREIRTTSAEAGYYSMFHPVEAGGGGLGAETYFRVWEHLCATYGPGRPLVNQAVSHWATGPGHMFRHLPEELRATVGAELIRGESTACFAMSEPDAGSDVWSISTRARRDGDAWVIDGTKQWISNGANANYVFVFAVTDEDLRRERKGGISCILVPTTTPGFNVDSVITLFGRPGGNEAILSFADVRVPSRNLVGPLHHGFGEGLVGLSLGRLYNTARAVGFGRWALELALGYTAERAAFGKRLADYQGVSFPLAEAATEVYAARLMGLDCARRMRAGDGDLSTVLAMTKEFSTEACFRTFDRCMQVHGAMGMTTEVRLYEGFHTARALRVADGSSEVLRRNIARALYRGDRSPFDG